MSAPVPQQRRLMEVERLCVGGCHAVMQSMMYLSERASEGCSSSLTDCSLNMCIPQSSFLATLGGFLANLSSTLHASPSLWSRENALSNRDDWHREIKGHT
eukprot:scaffold8099_cov79-Skeletonema_dohrnii-CCMP3373.AAC.2